ncbi:hypothetical protein ABEB36_011024 [Hypothenemus hampei]|uniref:Uncharacterized protein n=1 Tax=Hypothenemus hampei TaxID=57062 RepID=A0ABD1EFX8_HYPHA
MTAKQVPLKKRKIEARQLQEYPEDVQVCTNENEKEEYLRPLPAVYSLEDCLKEGFKEICQKCKCCKKMAQILKDQPTGSTSYESTSSNQSSHPEKKQNTKKTSY